MTSHPPGRRNSGAAAPEPIQPDPRNHAQAIRCRSMLAAGCQFVPQGDAMKAKKSRGKTKSAGKRAAKDLTARRGQGARGRRSDRQANVQFQLNDSNNTHTPAPRLVHETPHQK